MRFRAPAAALLLAVSAGFAHAWELESTSDDVDLLYESKSVEQSLNAKPADPNAVQPGNPDSDPFSEFDYEVHNRRSEPINYTVELTQCDNCRADLKTPLRVEPGQTVALGSVVRADTSKTWWFNFDSDWTTVGDGDPASNQQPAQDNPH